MTQKCGLIAVIGAPNAGKSTLVNALVGQKVAITSAKAQTTRARLLGIALIDQTQIILADTPGIFEPRRRLDRDGAPGRRAEPARGGRPAGSRVRRLGAPLRPFERRLAPRPNLGVRRVRGAAAFDGLGVRRDEAAVLGGGVGAEIRDEA